MKIRILQFLILLVVPTCLWAQADTIVYIEPIEIKGDRIRNEVVGSISKKWDTEAIENAGVDNIANLLNNEGNIFIKSYGLGSLATSSVRGGNAGHTLVLWNGLPLQSPMLGLLDLSLLPTNAAEEAIFQKGGSSANWGSGAIGGVVSLNNKPDTEGKLALDLQSKIGSFGEFLQHLQFKFGGAKLRSNTKLSYHGAKNDFSYEISPDLPLRQQTNAAFQQLNLQQDLYWFLKNNQQLSFHFWKQKAKREIPPATTQTASDAYQEDSSTRMIIDWKRTADQFLVNAKVGFFRERLDYFNPTILLVSKSNFNTLLTEANSQWNFSNHHKLSFALSYSFTNATADGYEESASDHRPALFTSYLFDKNRFQFQASLRQEFAALYDIPFIPAVGLNVQLNSFLNLKIKASKNYRLPTLNDKFWIPGGNIDLRPENGWSQEISLLASFKKENSSINFGITGFNKNINDWILWSISEGQSFWSATNVTEVWSRGVEPRLSFSFFKNKKTLQVDLGYDYIRSTNEIALQNPRIAKGEQLFYTPIHQAFGKLSISNNNLHVSYRHQYTGPSQGINEAIKGYQLGDLKIQLNIKSRIANWKLFFNLNNIWNTSFFVIERRAMPGRYWQAGFRLNLTSKNKNN